jgi:high affinity sulfate transporter 1
LIPQSLAYAPIAGLPSNYGLYSAFVCCLIYCVMGTAREVSVGPFALASLVVAQQVALLHPELADIDIVDPARGAQLHVLYGLTLTFTAGLILLSMAVLRLGWLVALLSAPAVSGFIMASSLTISTQQIAGILQLDPGQGSFVAMWVEILSNIAKTNTASLLIGLCCIPILLFSDLYSKHKQLKVPPPTQIILVILVTLISALAGFHSKYGVKVVGEIVQGYPAPTIPAFGDILDYLPGGATTAIVAFVVTASVGKHAAAANGYTVDNNAELLALGTCSFLGSFCNAYIGSGSISRTSVVTNMRPRTPLWNLVSAFLVLLCMFALAPLIFHLPRALLGAIIVVSFRNAYMKITEVRGIWARSPPEAVVYMVVFVVTLGLATQWGLISAFASSLGLLVLQLSRPRITELRRVKGTREYGCPRKFMETYAEARVLVVRVEARLHFANIDYLSSTVEALVEDRLKALEAGGAAGVEGVVPAAAAADTTASVNTITARVEAEAEAARRRRGAGSSLELSRDMSGHHARLNPESGADADGFIDGLGSNSNGNNNVLPVMASPPAETSAAQLQPLLTRYGAECPAEAELVLIISAEGMNAVDLTAAESLKRLVKRLAPRTHMIFYGLRPSVRKVIQRQTGMSVSATLHWRCLDEAVKFARLLVEKKVADRETPELTLKHDEDDAALGV